MMTARLSQMISRKGFTDLFFQEKNENPEHTYRDIFDRLNEEYQAGTGVCRYASYKSFERANLCKDRR